MPSVILFDMDGVIADSWKPFFGHWSQFLNNAGFPQFLDESYFLSLFEGNFFERLKQELGIKDLTRETISETVDTHTGFMESVDTFPGIPDILEKLSERHKLILITSNFASAAQVFLEHHQIHCFKKVLGAEHHPSKVRKIQSIAQLYPEQSLYYVGDTLGDMLEAREAGAIPIAAAWGWHDKTTLEKGRPSAILDTPAQLLDLTI